MNEYITLTITRLSDEAVFKREHGSEKQTRSISVEASIDRTVRRLILPTHIAQCLGYDSNSKNANVDVSDGKHTTCTTAHISSSVQEVIAGVMVLDGLREVIPLVGVRF